MSGVYREGCSFWFLRQSLDIKMNKHLEIFERTIGKVHHFLPLRIGPIFRCQFEGIVSNSTHKQSDCQIGKCLENF